jgi:hypothetical protein
MPGSAGNRPFEVDDGSQLDGGLCTRCHRAFEPGEMAWYIPPELVHRECWPRGGGFNLRAGEVVPQ